jgi:thiazole synthase
MDEWTLGNRAVTSRFFAPLAAHREGECMAVNTAQAEEIIRRSRTQFLILAPPEIELLMEAHASPGKFADLMRVEQVFAEEGIDYVLINNTTRSKNADEAIRKARRGYRATSSPYIKLEVLLPYTLEGNQRTLLPHNGDVIRAAKALVSEGLFVMPYIRPNRDDFMQLEDMGVAAIRLYGGYIGLNQGLRNVRELERIIREAKVPVIIEGGIGKPADAEQAMRLGASAVLVNQAIITAPNPGAAAEAFYTAITAGRSQYVTASKR